MAKYAFKKEDEDGNVIWHSTDGREYKTKAGAYKRSKKLEAEAEPEPAKVPEAVIEPETDDTPEWVEMDLGEIEEPSETIPAVLKKVRPRSGKGKPTKKQIEAEREVNESILMVGYRTGDMLMTRYKRGVLDDPDAEAVSHSEDDYQWIAGISQEALTHNGISIGAALGPNSIAIGANAIWFGSPMLKINAEAKKSPFQGRIGGAIGRFLEKMPIIGKRIRERRMRSIEQEWGEHD